MALLGMSGYWAEFGSWAKVIPPSPFTNFNPSVPSVPVPESTIPIARVFRSCAKEIRNSSMGL